MIVEDRPGHLLGDRRHFAFVFDVAEMTIRRHCVPVRYDRTKHGVALYDEAEVEAALAGIRRRRRQKPAAGLGWRTT